MCVLTLEQKKIWLQLDNIWPQLEHLGQSRASAHIKEAAGLLAAKLVGSAQGELESGREALRGIEDRRLEPFYKTLGDLLLAIPKAGFTGSGAPKSCAGDH